MMQQTHTRAAHYFAIALALQLVGCMAQSRGNYDIDRTPIVNTGARASIIYPGEGPMPMPGSAPPQGSTPPGSAPQAGTAPPGTAPAGGGLVFLGGARTQETRHLEIREDPLIVKYLTAPIALLAAPFVLAKESITGEPEPGPAIPRPTDPTIPQSRTAAAPPPPQRDSAEDYETAMLQNMEEELAQQRAPEPTSARPAQPSARPQAPSSSIEAELQALQRSPEPPRTDSERTSARQTAPSRATAAQPRASSAGSDQGKRTATASRPVQNSDNPYPTAHGIVDRNDDGRIDHWIFRENGVIVRQIFDENYDGRPDRTILFDAQTHQPSRVEEDTSGDGELDSWVDYHKGVIQRRRADGDGDGVVDTWSFFRAGELVRHEQDTTGDGFRDVISFFSDGQRVREERDGNGDGQADAILHYDSDEKLTRQEEDQDGDGSSDVISHYRDGRLTRRELIQAPEVAEGGPGAAPSKSIP